jgi:hypothetical protein
VRMCVAHRPYTPVWKEDMGYVRASRCPSVCPDISYTKRKNMVLYAYRGRYAINNHIICYIFVVHTIIQSGCVV